VLAYYRDSDFLTPRDVVGFELGLGCRFNCAFCNFDLRKLRNPKMSDPILIADTLNNLNSKYGLETFYITDDTINESLEKMEVLAEVVSRLNFKPNLAGFCRLDLLENPEQQKLWKKINLAAVFFGIESFNPEASRIVRKSSRVSSQIETLKKLRELTPNTFLSAGMIIGLTGDSKEHILQSMKYVADNNLLDAMQYGELGIPDMDTDVFDDYMLSDISKNPEKFGYEIVGRESTSIPGQSSQALKKWKNEWCDSDAAKDIFYEIYSYLKKYKIGYSDGFEYISFLSLGLIDSESNEVIKSINNQVIKKAAHSANKYRKEYIEKKKKWFIST
jgi:MoaA/NifB/PqqE/SkfB family radical SAM enzyme